MHPVAGRSGIRRRHAQLPRRSRRWRSGCVISERIGIETIHTRVRCLTGVAARASCVALRHSNGRHMVRIYGPTTTIARGGTITMNFYDPEGHLLDYRRVEELAGEQRHLAAHRLLLQPRRGRNGGGDHRGATCEAALETGADMNLPRFLQFDDSIAAARAPARSASRSASSAISPTHSASSDSPQSFATRRAWPSERDVRHRRRPRDSRRRIASFVKSSGIDHACRRPRRWGCAWHGRTVDVLPPASGTANQ